MFLFPSREANDEKVQAQAQQIPFLRRVCAYMIDYNLIIFVLRLINIGLKLNSYALEAIVAVLLGVWYKTSNGSTLGQKLLKIRLVSEDGEKLKLTQTMSRALSFSLVLNLVFKVLMDFFNFLNDGTFEYPFVFGFYIILMFLVQFIYIAHVLYTGMIKKRPLFYERLSKTHFKSNI